MAGDIRILLVGKASLVRDSLAALLSAQEDFNVLASLEGDIDAIQSAAVAAPPPRVALIHVRLLTASGLGTITALRRRWPEVRVLTLTSRVEAHLLGATTEAGIDGYILEGDSHEELLAAIRAVGSGERYVSPSISSQDIGGPGKLTERETEVMKLIAIGHRNREIANRLSVSLKTVEKHRASLMRKLGLRSAAAVVAYAIAHGFVIV
jgi:DNA-binding NarL/FixJ family response regulator